MLRKSNIKLSLAVFIFIAAILSIVQLKLDNPIIILERFIKGGGWLEIFVISIMTILFLSTIVLSGPAWCSHLCYFGALDGLAACGKTEKGKIKNKLAIKYTLLLFIIVITLILRWLRIPILVPTIAAIAFGVLGIMIILILSARKGKMYHCVLYCPVSTVVNYLRFINPFRLYIDKNCTLCMKCTSYCKYDALNIENIKRNKPAVTCTLCGDCLVSCKENSIKYRFLIFNPEASRNLYLFITISVHAIFLALARI